MDFYIKQPEDYRVVEFMVNDTIYEPNHEEFFKVQQDLGEDGYITGNFGYSPMHMIMQIYLGVERFALELQDHPDEIMSLYEAIVEQHRRAYPLIAECPADVVLYGGNVSGEVVGKERFEKYYVPHYNKFADYLHEKGKLAGSHMDAMLKPILKSLGDCKLDLIEAFTPTPDCDTSTREAREAWPGKVIWMNFPSSVHLARPEVIREETLKILREAAPGDRFIVGVTENVPEHAWRTSMSTISQVLRESGSLPIRV